jgi:hypothetical protein
MWLILAQAADEAARWVYHGLRARGLAPLELVTAEALAQVTLWEHRLGAAGDAVTIRLADGRTMCSDTLRGALNRLVSVPPGAHIRAQPADRDYAMQELHALYMSWLRALPGPILNPPTGQCLSGEHRHASEWTALAARAGLPVSCYRQSSSDPRSAWGTDQSGAPQPWGQPARPVHTVLVVGGHVVGEAAPPAVQAGCRRLAHLVHTPLLGVDFAAGEAGPWTFVGATPAPDLRLGGEPLLDVLSAVLRSGVGAIS